MNLFKVNGELKHRNKLLHGYRAMRVANAKKAWEDSKRTEWEALDISDVFIANPDYVDEATTPDVNPNIVNDAYVEFDVWLNETNVTPAVDATYDENGVELTAYEPEIIEYVNGEFVTPDIPESEDRKSTRLNSSHTVISYAVFCLTKKKMLNYSYILLHYTHIHLQLPTQ